MNHADICARLPHAGRMCLLDSLESWDAENIICLAVSHRDVDHPLRADGCLHAVAGVEYAAQAMALHGSLVSADDAPMAMGYLASVRDLRLEADDLAVLASPLRIHAQRLSGDVTGFIYAFELSAGGKPVLAGRAAVRQMAAGEIA